MLRIVSDLPLKSNSYEMVERKGVGHPDTICDAIAERASALYSQYFLNKFGKLAHHWFDKVMLIGGESLITYGKGVLTSPYKVIFAGKCVKKFMGEDVPVIEIFTKASNEVLSSVLMGFDCQKDLLVLDETVDYQGSSRKGGRYRPQSINDLVDPEDTNRVSNDCNLVCAYAPLSVLEDIVQQVEKAMTIGNLKKEFPMLGTDIKIVGFCENGKYKLLVNAPFLASQIFSYEQYVQISNKLIESISEFIRNKYQLACEIEFNPSDRENKPYLTSLGSAADTGDVGVVGRGNRINGLITLKRCMSIEAPAGKNPIDHTGKLYAIAARRMADLVYEKTGIPVEVSIYVSKSTPIKKPNEVVINLQTTNVTNKEKKLVELIVNSQLDNICSITLELIQKGIVLW